MPLHIDHSNCDHDTTKAARAKCRDQVRAEAARRVEAARRLILRAEGGWDPAWGRRSILTIAARIAPADAQVILPTSRISTAVLPSDPARRYTPTDGDVYAAALYLTDQGWDFSMICHALS